MLLNLEQYIASWFVDIAVKSIDLESTFEVHPKHGCLIIIEKFAAKQKCYAKLCIVYPPLQNCH